MRFRLSMAVLFLFLLIFSCSGGVAKTPLIGSILSDQTSLYQSYGVRTQFVFFFDEHTNRIVKINLDEMRIENTFDVEKSEQDHVLASNDDGAYVIDFSTKHLEIIKSDGTRHKKPFSFQGTPVSAAFNPKLGLMAIQDDLLSIGLMKISPEGDIQKSWLGGSLIAKDKSIWAGDIDAQGHFLLSVSDKSFAIVDVEKSMDSQAWKFDSVSVDIEEVQWVAPDYENEDLFLVLGKDSVGVFDVKAQKIVDEISLKESSRSVLGKSKLSKPHILIGGKNVKEIIYIGEDEKLARRPLPDASFDNYSSSYLDLKTMEFASLRSDGANHRVGKVRLSDNLVIFDETISSEGDVQLGGNLLFVNKKNHLGFVQKYDLIEQSVEEIKGFNFDFFRSK